MPTPALHLTRDALRPRLNRLASTARRPEAVLRAMGAALLRLTTGNFNHAAYRPIPWKPKTDGTPSRLQKTGALLRSFRLDVTATQATVSTPVIYAATHQFGRPQGRGAIPARPFFPVTGGRLTPAAREQITLAAQRALERQMR